jgi:DNA-binding NarL/FixJ family response regulator
VIRVFLVEDEDLFRSALRAILEAQADIEVAGEAADGHEALLALRQLSADAVLMDIRMAGLNGLAVARRLREQSSRPARILFLTTFDLDEYIDEALAIGAAGFILKSASSEELLAAVRAVAGGEAFLAPSVTRRVIEAFARRRLRLTRRPQELASLTEREREVLVHLARGRTNREISTALRVGEATVRTHVGHVLMKLNLRDRTQAAVLASESGILDGEL